MTGIQNFCLNKFNIKIILFLKTCVVADINVEKISSLATMSPYAKVELETVIQYSTIETRVQYC